ncbi:MAG: hypothetical protein KJ907_11850 [Actinobacteria bacterium]|nr:hypothetical protein [Actinomycetota bacterium]MBU4403411.1 hypothetical protein [Actinomycetota bacterium]MBU4441046.1 hypothetical protein [Actinomycetota bacterium]
MANEWWSCKKCELETVRPEARWIADALESDPRKEGDQCWAFVFGGKLKPYRPTAETLLDALNLTLALPATETDKPPRECLSFMRRWGPIGLFTMRTNNTVMEKEGWIVKLKTPNEAEHNLFLDAQTYISHEEYWNGFHVQRIKDEKKLPLTMEPLFNGYLEYWPLVYREFNRLQRAADSWLDRGSTRDIEEFINNNLREQLNPHSPDTPRVYEFKSLRDALFGLLANEITGGRLLGRCAFDTCQRFFLADDSRSTYCCAECRKECNRQRLEKKRREPLQLQKRKLRSLLDTRETIGIITVAKDREIRDEINKARSRDELAVVKKKHQEVFEHRKKGPRASKGRD